jgi:hypothetical protein
MLEAKILYCITSGLQYSVLRVGTREGATRQGTEIAKVVGKNIDKKFERKTHGARVSTGMSVINNLLALCFQ